MTQAQLDLIEIRKVLTVSDLVLRHWNMEPERQMVYELKVVFAGTRQDPYSYFTFDSLLEHFKDRWFPKWAKRRWPARKAEHRVDVTLLYPKLKSPLPPEAMGDRVCLMLRGPDATTFSMFDPDQPLPEHEYFHKMAESVPLFNPSDPRCPTCTKPWRLP